MIHLPGKLSVVNIYYFVSYLESHHYLLPFLHPVLRCPELALVPSPCPLRLPPTRRFRKENGGMVVSCEIIFKLAMPTAPGLMLNAAAALAGVASGLLPLSSASILANPMPTLVKPSPGAGKTILSPCVSAAGCCNRDPQLLLIELQPPLSQLSLML
jgi:hypothetical protein